VPDRFTVLLDENIPTSVVSWLIRLKPFWTVYHTSELDLSGKLDEEVFAWAQRNGALV
jgi:predicted nuclease of predicted toxin-antitoxin system